MAKNPVVQKKSIPLKNEESGFFDNNRINLIILLLLWIVILRELITGNAWLFDDFPYVYYPGKFLSAVSLANGIFPFWNPYSFSGTPFFADPQIAVLYPFNYLLRFFVSGDSLSPLIIQNFLLIHFYLCSVFCYFLGKELKFGNFTSLVFSVIYTYSGYMIIHMMHYNLIETVVWLPLLILLLLKFFESENYIYIISAGILMSFSILAGYPQCFFYNFIFILVFSAYYILKEFKNRNSKKTVNLILGTGMFFVISAGIASVQLLPTLIFSQNSDRVDAGYDFIKQGSVHPYDLITLLVPKIFGTFNWNENAGEMSYWSIVKNGGHQEGPWMYTVSTMYLTILPLILILPVIYYSFKSKQKTFPVSFLIVFSFIILLFSFGGNFFLHRLFFDFVPFFDRFRNPGHVLYLFSFCILLISSFGLNEIIKNKSIMKNYFSVKYFAGVAGFIILFFILSGAGFFKSFSQAAQNPEVYSWITKQVNIFVFISLLFTAALYFYFQDKLNIKYFSVFLLLLVFLDIYIFGYNQNNGNQNPLEMYSRNADLINQIKKEGKSEQFRVNMRDGGNMLFQRYQGAVDKIQLVEGVNVLRLNRIVPPTKKDTSVKQALDLLNVKYRINTDKKKNTSGLVKSDTYLPRAKMFYDVKVIENPDEIKKYMESSEFDYNKTIVIEKNPGNISLPEADSSLKNSQNVVIRKYDLNNIQIEAETRENGFLFLSEVYYPDWKAYVDGKETEIFRTDYSLRSVYLEKGSHIIEFVYDSPEFNLGSKVSSAVFALSILSLGLLFLRKRNSNKQNA